MICASVARVARFAFGNGGRDCCGVPQRSRTKSSVSFPRCRPPGYASTEGAAIFVGSLPGARRETYPASDTA